MEMLVVGAGGGDVSSIVTAEILLIFSNCGSISFCGAF